MNNKLSIFSRVTILVLFLVLTLANLIFAWPCEEATQGSWICEHETVAECRGTCGGFKYCDFNSITYWAHHCDYGLCYELWSYWCLGGGEYSYDCISPWGRCPMK